LTGLTQYLTKSAIQQTMRDVAGLAPATTYVATFAVPLEATDPADRDLVALTVRLNQARRRRDHSRAAHQTTATGLCRHPGRLGPLLTDESARAAVDDIDYLEAAAGFQ